MTLQEQAWSSASPSTVLAELTSLHKVRVDGDKLIVNPVPSPRLTFQIRRHKPKLLELLGAGKTLEERIKEAQAKLGWKPASEDDGYQQEERHSIQTEHAYREKSITKLYQQEDPQEMQAPWEVPTIIRQEYCQHSQAQHYRVKVDGKAVVKLLCPACGHNLKGPRRFTEPKKRSTVAWWPPESTISPDPDSETDELVEWWDKASCAIVDGCTWAEGIIVQDARKFIADMNERIMLWKFGDTDAGLKAQLSAHKAYLEKCHE